MPIGGERVEKYPRENPGGAIYSVDDVSDLLGIPRPTLYRYLREYSIPHLRQGGRIQIPEDSFDAIRAARDLHKEGLGTESVRRQLREGSPDTGELDRRLNRLHETLEDLRGDLREKPAISEVALSPVLRTILARQSLMLSAMFNLTGMVEDLLLNNGKSRKRPVHRFEDGLAGPAEIAANERGQIPGPVPVAVREAEAPTVSVPTPDHSGRFGSLGRRRRRGILAILSALLLGLLLALFLLTPNGNETETSNRPAPQDAAEQQGPPDQRPAGAGENVAADNDSDDGPPDEASTAETDEPSENVASPAENAQTGTRDRGGRIPNVTGRPLESAARTLSEAGYTVAAIRTEAGSEEPGTVVATEPSAGTDVRRGAPVVLTMSAGPNGVTSASASSAGVSSASTSSASASSAGASASASPSP